MVQKKKKYSRLKRNTPITALQKQVLEYVRSFREEHKNGPTFAEVAKAVGSSSGKGGLSGTLHGLRRRGLITWAHRVPRSLAVVDHTKHPKQKEPVGKSETEFSLNPPFSQGKLPSGNEVKFAARVIRSRIATLQHEIRALEEAYEALTRVS